MKNSWLKFLWAPLLLLLAASANGSDLAKEKRWREQIVDALISGEACPLKAGDTEFLGIYTGASDGPTGRAVVLLHGMGAHPDWPEVIHPLRTELPEHGWATLSIQLPVLANDAPLKDYAPLFDEAASRIAAAVDYLRKQDNETIVLVGHSLGASMAARYLAGKDAPPVDGFVAIGLSVITLDDGMNSARALEKIDIPVFDLYGSRDMDGVLASAGQRASAARKAGNDDYRQQRIEGADHFFLGMQDTLVRTVYGWLRHRFVEPDPAP
ncbi:MAG TPA: alpha/beta fold hydrolase [Gammaproteobacteria bacterium]|nr:alpha/beta fold hydrolase [Gammaproteobacteria bacterium]